MVAKSSGVLANTAQAAPRSSTFLNPQGTALRYGLEVCSFSHPTGNPSVGARNQKCWALICGAQKRPNPTSLAAVKWLKRQALERRVRANEVKTAGFLNEEIGEFDMVQVTTIGFAGFNTTQMEAMLAYYTEAIGFTLEERGGVGVSYLSSAFSHQAISLYHLTESSLRPNTIRIHCS